MVVAPGGTGEDALDAPQPDEANRLSAELNRLWLRYKEDGAGDAREMLVLHYSPLVKYVASRVATGLPASVDQADLVSDGMIGLMDAIEKFQPERQIKFETYAMQRIKGAIIDALRQLDWVPRSVRLEVNAVAHQAQLSWPTNSGNWVLQYSTSLLTDGTWTDVTDAPAVLGDRYVLTQTTFENSRFYRLRAAP